MITYEQYIWVGGSGCVLKSYEHHVTRGHVRFVNGCLIYAYLIYPRRFRKPEVWWCLVSGDYDDIKQYKEKFI
jgi:hypothetical protein